MTRTKPLAIPDGFPEHYPGPQSEFRKKHPLRGWLAAQFRPSKWRLLEREISEILKSRSTSLQEEWNDYPEYQDTLLTLQRIFREHLWGTDITFIPEDPYCIIGQLVTGDLCEVEAIMAIEETFGLRVEERELTAETTMLEFVEFVYHRQTRPPAIQ